MANKIIKHYYDDEYGRSPYETASQVPKEPDKTKSIAQLTRQELRDMRMRLQEEQEVQRTIKEIKRNSGERDTFEQPFKVDTTTPINQLYHFGILGQKWGVRRYQNEDGTRTPSGKKRDRTKEGEEKSKSDDHMKSRIAKSKAPTGLSNDELRTLNERLQLEDTYKRLSAKKKDEGQSWVKKALSTAGEQALADFSKGVMLGSAKLLVKELSPQLAEAAFNVKEKKKD